MSEKALFIITDCNTLMSKTKHPRLMVLEGALGMVDSESGRSSKEDRRSAKLQLSEECMESPLEVAIVTVTSPRTSQADSWPGNDHPLKAKRNLGALESSILFPDAADETKQFLTDRERQEWKGWVELESDPALFSYILRSYGVKDVKVQEVVTLDHLSELPKPVYGLVFLFKYRDDDAEEAEELPKCPKDVWFANQTNDNACATVAMLNIVMNAPQIELGDTLDAFKRSTRKLKPSYRGQRLSSDEFIRGIHNTFVRRMDILNADLALSNEYEKWAHAKKAAEKVADSATRKSASSKSPRTLRRTAKASRKRKRDDDEAGYHFIAYVPVNNAVWRLDGLQRHPTNIGEVKGAWMSIARDNILQRIAQYEGDGIEYSLMALCRSPLHTIRGDLARNLKSLSAVDQELQKLLPNRAIGVELDKFDTSADLLESFGLSPDMIDQAVLEDSAIQLLSHGTSRIGLILDLRKSLVEEQSELKAAYAREVTEFEHENRQAESRKCDYTSVIYDAVKHLASENELKDIVLDVHGK